MSCLTEFALQIGLKVNQKKTEVTTLNIQKPLSIQANGDDLPTTKEFIYLGSTVTHDGGAGVKKTTLEQSRNCTLYA